MSERAADGEAGFGLVELLVALAICSFIVVGIGGLLGFVGQLRDRTESTASVQRSLLELMSLASALSEPSGAELTGVTPSGFALRTPPANSLATVALRDGRLDVEYNGVDNSISVDLSVFETSTLEYLSISGQAAVWEVTWEHTASPRAVRLLMRKRPWNWPLLLWVADRRESP